MNIKEQLKSKTLSELFMLIRNAHGATALAASEEIERRLSSQQSVQVDAPKNPDCKCNAYQLENFGCKCGQ